ncbi:MAG: amidohydrolase [Candidatus Aenigmarchaeota archaeon]|nr:amidohydrolase [Candidatus Aenigmarchaeota archaeon]
MSILVKDASYVVTQNKKRQVLKDVDIFVEDNEIREIGKKLKAKAEHVINGKWKVVLPGLVNLHTHAAMTLFRGFADDMDLFEWLNKRIWPIEDKLNEEDVFWGTMLANIEMIKSGTTSFLDMYYFMDEVAKASQKTGMRGFLSIPVTDKEFSGDKDRITRAESFIKKWKNTPRIYPSVGPHSIYLCSAENLQKSDEISKKNSTILNIHLSETEKEVKDSLKKFGKTPVSYMKKLGMLSPRLVTAHSIWVSEKEIQLLAKSGTNVAHCPISNMKLASGLAPIYQMIRHGVNVGLGTDSVASNNNLNLFEEIKISALLQKMKHKDSKIVNAQEALDMGTLNGARALGMKTKLGSVENGMLADLITIDISKPHLYPVHDIVSHLVYSASGSDVNDSIIDGEIVMKDRKIMSVDETETIHKFESQVQNLFSR